MSNLFCTDCRRKAIDVDGGDYCLWKDCKLSEHALITARNVPPQAYGYCDGFTPEIVPTEELVFDGLGLA